MGLFQRIIEDWLLQYNHYNILINMIKISYEMISNRIYTEEKMKRKKKEIGIRMNQYSIFDRFQT